jgi:hypothetical protein
MVGAMQWLGNQTNYLLLHNWTDGAVHIDGGGGLSLETEDGIETVEKGNYIVNVGGYFHQLTPDEFEESYVRVADEETL